MPDAQATATATASDAIATTGMPAAPPATSEPIDWSKSDFYLEAEALSQSIRISANNRPPPEPPLIEWWMVNHKRVAVRGAPVRSAPILDVLGQGSIVRTSVRVTQHGSEEAPWLKLDASDYAFLCNKKKSEEGYMLVTDPVLGDLLTPVDVDSITGHLAANGMPLKEGESLIDATLHPRDRGRAIAIKVGPALEKVVGDASQAGKDELPSAGSQHRLAMSRDDDFARDVEDPGDVAQDAEDPGGVADDAGDDDVTVEAVNRLSRSSKLEGGQVGPDRFPSYPHGALEGSAIAAYHKPAGPARPPWLAKGSGAEAEEKA